MKTLRVSLSLLAVLFLFTGCDDEDNALAPFEPEIVNTADAFQFQITDARNVSVDRSYTWNNTNTRGSVDHSTSRTDGAGTVVILDADGTEVYRSAMRASGSDQTDVGVAGDWTVRVIFEVFDGTANFRVEKL